MFRYTELMQRDTKGLYQKAKSGEIDNLIGFSKKLPYEEPNTPDLVIRTDQAEIEESIAMILIHLPVQKWFLLNDSGSESIEKNYRFI